MTILASPTPATSSSNDAEFVSAENTKQLLMDRVKSLVKVDGGEEQRLHRLLDVFVDQAASNAASIEANLLDTIKNMINRLDSDISRQLGEIMHNKEFLRLEGSWRGLQHLVTSTDTSQITTGERSPMKLKVMQVRKGEIEADFRRSDRNFRSSHMYRKIYTAGIGTPGADPYGALMVDYEFTPAANDIRILQGLADIGEESLAPVITAAAPEMLGCKGDFANLNNRENLSQIFTTEQFAGWRSLRERSSSRYLVMSLPRVLIRQPYGKGRNETHGFQFEESGVAIGDGQTTSLGGPISDDKLCWTNAAYMLAGRLTDAFDRTGWCTAIRGMENGGKVEDLPIYHYATASGDIAMKVPTGVTISTTREKELGDCGFLPLVPWKDADYAVFLGSDTVHRPANRLSVDAAESERLSARLPYIMAASRFGQYLSVMGLRWIGRNLAPTDLQSELSKWISNYTNASDSADETLRARYPLKAARIDVEEVPGRPGEYQARAFLVPHIQMEALTASLSLVARIPSAKG